MGQMTIGIMLGHMGAPPRGLRDGWYSLVEKYRAGPGPVLDTPGGEGLQGIGFWIAIGGDGDNDYAQDGVQQMPRCVAWAALEVTEPYASKIRAIRAAWPAFATWAETKKPKGTRGPIVPPEPRLYLVATEVA